MAWSTGLIGDLSGLVAVVTGAGGGLGLATSRHLARHGIRVVMAVREPATAGQARDHILAAAPRTEPQIRQLDLGSLSSIREFAAAMTGTGSGIDILVNNAGLMATPDDITTDGHELQFGTNHLGHFALTALLAPALLRSPVGRIVTVTSSARHWGGRRPVDHPRFAMRYDPWTAYGRSKMANFRFALELDQRLRAAGSAVRSVAADPGFSNTDLQARSARTQGGMLARGVTWAVRRIGTDPMTGALPQVRAATDPAVRGGDLVRPRWLLGGPPIRRRPGRRSRDRAAAGRLWELSEQATGVPFDVAAIVAAARN